MIKYTIRLPTRIDLKTDTDCNLLCVYVEFCVVIVLKNFFLLCIRLFILILHLTQNMTIHYMKRKGLSMNRSSTKLNIIKRPTRTFTFVPHLCILLLFIVKK